MPPLYIKNHLIVLNKVVFNSIIYLGGDDVEEKRMIDVRESVKVVTSNNFFRASGLEDITLKARKMLYLAIAQCRKKDDKFYEYSITVSEFAKLMEIDKSNVYKEADSITDELMKGFIKFTPDDSKKKFIKFNIFEKCIYGDGTLTFKISEDMTPILLNLKKDFTQPLLSDFMKFKSNFSIELWHLFQMKMKSRKCGVTEVIEFDLSLKELRTATGTIDKFERISRFKDKVLEQARKEIADNLCLDVQYTPIKEKRTIVAFHFNIQSLYHVEEEEIPEEVRKRVEKVKKKLDIK